MTRIILSGCFGKMGRVTSAAAEERDDCEIVAGVDIKEDSAVYPVYESFAGLEGVAADVIVDFSHPSVLKGLLAYAKRTNCPAVIATTGLGEAQIEMIRECSESIPIFFSANMSLGISLLSELAAKAARVLGNPFDIEIVEMHHDQKLDAPSGTALMLADHISGALQEKFRYEFDRHSKRMKRGKNEIGIHSIRGGTVVGEHSVIFAGPDEILTLSHSARSKELFAAGALNAAFFLCGKPAGLYTMKQLVEER